MLNKYVDIVDYSRWFSDISTKAPFQPSVEKQSYVAKSKISNQTIPGSSLSNSPVPRSKFKVPGQIPSQKRKVQVLVHPPPSKQKHWLIKNHEVLKVNFKNLWIILRLFASDDWKLIRKMLAVLFQTKIVINHLYDENALISIDQGSILNLIYEEGK